MWDWAHERNQRRGSVAGGLAGVGYRWIAGGRAGARAADEVTRIPEFKQNPAAQLALMWYFLGEGRGSKGMVVLSYKDRLELFSMYLQQLLMESLGKELDLDGRIVNAGISVYGNKVKRPSAAHCSFDNSLHLGLSM